MPTKRPVERVVVGELVCSKRLPFYEDVLPETIERLHRAGKRVALTSLALPTLARERDAAKELFRSGVEVKLNDLSALGAADGKAFSVGPLINVYNEATLGFLVHRGAKAFCLPPELPFASIRFSPAPPRRFTRSSKCGLMAARRWRFPRAVITRASMGFQRIRAASSARPIPTACR